jgi:predicted TIM-barrel fold metal-dependent hydrolase
MAQRRSRLRLETSVEENREQRERRMTDQRTDASTQDLDWVIDCDTHISEPPDLFTSRLPRKWQEAAPKIVFNEQTGFENWVIGTEQHASIPVGHTAVAGWPEPFPAAPAGFAEIPKAAHDPHARLEYMDSLKIWAMALYPNVSGFGSQAFLDLGSPELMLACVRAYNDFLTDWCEPGPDRFIPISSMPFWDVPACIKEIEYCAKAGHKGILFTGAPQDHGQPALASPHWDPLWACAQDHDLPVSFHIGSGEFTGSEWTPERLALYGPGGINAQTSIGLFLENGRQIVDLLFSGVLPRFPDLKFVSVESGIGFIPFLLEAADHTFSYGQIQRDRPEFKMKPSEYFARQVYGCYWFEEYAPAEMLDKLPVDNILFETDYPHPVCLFGDVREKIEAGLGKADPVNRRKLLFDNAAKLYKIDGPQD